METTSLSSMGCLNIFGIILDMWFMENIPLISIENSRGVLLEINKNEFFKSFL
jgi:hypothetical protein